MKLSVVPAEKFTAYRIELDTAQQPVAQEPEPTNHIWIFDRSGSMHYLLPDLVEDLIKHVETLRDGDTLSLGWFSTEGGEFDFIFKGMTINATTRAAVATATRKLSRTVGLTCFSEILLEASEKLIPNIEAFPGPFSLMFMTDGYPVVSNRQREIHNIMHALGRLSSKLSSVLLVGYGDYYNKELMAQMAAKVGGALIHSSHLKEFSTSMAEFVGGDVAPSKRVEVVLPVHDPLMVLGITGDMITIFPVDQKNTITTVALVPKGTQYVYVLANREQRPDLTWYRDGGCVSDDQIYKIFAAFAYNALSSARGDLALELMATTGDIRLMDKIINSWTNEEYGEAQRSIQFAVVNENVRYMKGVNKNYLPREDAFCLLDALNALMGDDDAYFYPRHPAFAYKRTGVPTKTREGYPKFEADCDTGCRFSNLTWNSKRLNLSLLAKITGHVMLPADSVEHGFGGALDIDRLFFCHQWRNYTLVKDGILNVTELPASMNRDTFNILKANGMIDPLEQYGQDKVFVLKLNAVPLVNRQMARAPKATEFCDWLDEELTLEFAQKYLKHWLEEVDPSGELTKDLTEFTPEQEAYLATLGIKPDRTYSPPVDKGEAVDHYIATEFEVKIAKFSSAPKIDDVLKALSFQKSLTPSQQLMADVIKAYESRAPRKEDTINLAAWVKKELDSVKHQLKSVRNKIQGTRFAVLLCKQWFPDLNTREGAEVNRNNRNFTFTIREVEVDY